jgi:hypothetical protein
MLFHKLTFLHKRTGINFIRVLVCRYVYFEISMKVFQTTPRQYVRCPIRVSDHVKGKIYVNMHTHTYTYIHIHIPTDSCTNMTQNCTIYFPPPNLFLVSSEPPYVALLCEHVIDKFLPFHRKNAICNSQFVFLSHILLLVQEGAPSYPRAT